MSIDFQTPRPAVLSAGFAVSGACRLSQASAPAFAVPVAPTADELAQLVGELYQEGSLSRDQLTSLALAPDLAPRLAGLLAEDKR